MGLLSSLSDKAKSLFSKEYLPTLAKKTALGVKKYTDIVVEAGMKGVATAREDIEQQGLPTREERQETAIQTVKTLGTGAKVLGQELLAGMSVIGKSTMQAMGVPVPSEPELERKVFGRETDPAIQRIATEARIGAEKLGATPFEASTSAILAGLGVAFIESPVGLPSKGTKPLKAFIKANTKEAEQMLLKSGISDEVAPIFAKQLGEATDEKVIDDILRQAESAEAIRRQPILERASKLADSETELSIRKDALSEHQGKDLIKYESKARPGELPEVVAGAKSQFGKRGDVIAMEIAGREGLDDSLDEASVLLKSYIKERDAIKVLEKSVKTEMAEVKALLKPEAVKVTPPPVKDVPEAVKAKAPLEEIKDVTAKAPTQVVDEIAPSVSPKVLPSQERVTTLLPSKTPNKLQAPSLPLKDTTPEKTLQFFDIPKGKISKYMRGNKFLLEAQEVMQDTEARALRLMKEEGVKVNDKINFYQEETLFHGKVNAVLEATYDEVDSLVRDTVKVAESMGKQLDEVTGDIDKYLLYRHAPERNLQHGENAAGITTKNAKVKLAELESEYGKDFKQIVDKWQTMNERTLDVLLDSGVIKKETYDTLRKTYKNHVPLYRILGEESTDDFVTSLGRGLSTKTSGIKKAKGSELKAAPITENILFNVEQATIRAHKNEALKSAGGFFTENAKKFKDVAEVRGVRMVGETFDGQPIFEKPHDITSLQYFENGKKKVIEFTDPKMKQAFDGMNDMQMHDVLKVVATATRAMASMATRFNPEFALGNNLRDIPEAIINASANGMGLKTARRELFQKSKVDVYDWLRGKDTEGAKLFDELRREGGTTGGLGLSTKKEVELSLKRIYDLRDTTRKGIKAKTARGLRNTLDTAVRGIDAYNQVIEDSVRLSTYKAYLDAGYTKKKAAFAAKNSTVNFNKKGKITPLLNSIYMFTNATVQGQANMTRTLITNPKVLLGVAAGLATATALTADWNDDIDPEWRSKVSKWDKNSNLVILTGKEEDGTLNYLTIPVSYGIKPLKVMIQEVNDARLGKSSGVASSIGNVMGAMIDAYNPTGGSDIVQTMTPTVADPFMDIWRNVAWHEGGIRPEWKEDMARIEQVYHDEPENLKEDVAYAFAKAMDKVGLAMSPLDYIYMYDQFLSGAGKSAARFIETMKTLVTEGKLPDKPKDVPFMSRIYKEVDPKIAQARVTKDLREDAFEQIKAADKDTRKDMMRQFMFTNDRKIWDSLKYRLTESGFKVGGVTGSFTRYDDGTIESLNVLNSLPKETRDEYIQYQAGDVGQANYLKYQIAGEMPDATPEELGQAYVDAGIGKRAKASSATMLAHFKRVQLLENDGMPETWKELEKIKDDITPDNQLTETQKDEAKDILRKGAEDGSINEAFGKEMFGKIHDANVDAQAEDVFNQKAEMGLEDWKSWLKTQDLDVINAVKKKLQLQIKMI